MNNSIFNLMLQPSCLVHYRRADGGAPIAASGRIPCAWSKGTHPARIGGRSVRLRPMADRFAKTTGPTANTSQGLKAAHECSCIPLHFRCDPQTCDKAEECKRLQTNPEGQSDAKLSVWPMETKLSSLRLSAMTGCSTCGVIYAGVKLETEHDDPYEFSEYPDLVRRMKCDYSEDKIIVRVKYGIENVEVSHTELKGTQRFNFYATQDSSMSFRFL
jgi:hypothetical protein